MASLPIISGYGDYSSENYGVNCLKVDLGTIILWRSYDTIVAYRDEQDGWVIAENTWGTTTGKHLNWIHSDHSIRKDWETFETMLAAALERHIK